MKKYISTILFSLFAVLGAVAQNTVSVSIVEGTPGEVANVDVLLQNSDNVTAAEVVIPLANKQLTYVDGSCMIDSERANGHRLSAAVVDGALKIYIYSMSLAPFNGNDGKLASFSLRLGSSPAEYPLQPKVVLSDTNGKALPVSVVDGAVTILAPQIEVVTPSVDFGRVPIMAHYSRNLTLRNSGTLPLEVSDIQLSNNIFSISETAFNIAAGATKNITVNYSPTVRGAVDESITVLSNATNGNATIKLLAEPYSVNELHSSRVEGFAGEEVTIELRMNNMEPIVGLQTTFTLPNGIEYVDGSFATTERAASHTATASFSNGKLSLFLYSVRNAPMSGNDGVIATFRLRLNCNSGSYRIAPQNTVLGNAALENMVSAVSGEYIVVKSPNINGSNELDFGRTPVTETAKATYVLNNNGKAPLVINNVVFLSSGYNITNVLPMSVEPGTTAVLNVEYTPTAEGAHSTTMNIYSNDPDEKMKSVKVSGTVYEPNNLTFEGENLQNGDYVVSIGLDNYTGIVAMQMDIHWMPGMTTSGDRLKVSSRLAGHSCSITKMDEDTYRFIAFSFGNNSIAGNEGKLFDLTFTPANGVDYKDTPIVIDKVVLSSSGANNYTSQLALNVLAEYSHYYVRFMCEDKLVSECFQKVGSAVVYPQMPERTGHSFRWELEGGNRTLAYPIDIAANADEMLYSNAYCTQVGTGGDKFQGWHVLFDDNTGTFFHSEYASNKPSTDGLHHYLRVDLGAGNEVERFSFTYATRRGYTVGSPTRIVVEGSNVADGEYEEIAVLTGMPTSNSTYSSDTLGNGNRYRYIRFRVTETYSNQSPSGHPFFYISEFGMTKYVKVPTVLETVPSNDVVLNGLYTPNSYRVTYKVDGEVYATDSVVYGNEIVLREFPGKEGHTFGGWSEAPATMPAEDIVIEGSFTVNSYVVTYMVDGEEYETVSVVYGTPVTLIDEPVKEGHTFSGWSESPATMPAEDIVIEGLFAVNKYAVIYKVDGVVFATDSVAYGCEVILREQPAKEGHTFSGWSEAPATMPANDITVEGGFSVNSYNLIYKVDGQDYKVVPVVYGTPVTLIDEPVKEGHTFSGWKGEQREIPGVYPIDIASNADNMLYSNAYCTDKTYGDEFKGWHVLFDNNPATFFHSEYNAGVQSSDGLEHYIRVDLGVGNEIEKFSFTYSNRQGMSSGSPTRMVVEGSNVADGEYEEIAVLTGMPTSNSTYTSDILGNGNRYRFVRFRVTETSSNQSPSGHPFFYISEFGMTRYVEAVSIPVVMPAEDVVIEGTFAVNSYVITYMVDGEVYKTETVAYGAEIPVVELPVKVGHTFDCWTGIPTTMPAMDITVNAGFTVNSYVVTYMVDGEVYKTETIAYGSKFVLPENPTKEGHTFSGWKDEKEDGYVTRPIDIASNADKMLYSNAYCTMGGDRFVGWHVLFDNDMSTYFHSEYAADKTSTDGLDHYLRVDLGDGNEIENFSFTYTNRHDNNSGAPTEIVVEGSNVADGEYTEIAVLADMSTSNSTVGESATLSFADKAQRTVFNANQQIWVQNGVSIINNKAASSNAVADYAKPARFYAKSEIIVECELGNITQILFDCNSSSYATALKNSIGDNATTTVSSDKVTVTLDGTSNSFTIAKLTAQVRLDAITVTCAAQECTTYNSDILGNGDKYRYIRFRATKTVSNSSPSGHPYFCISEFGMTEYVEATSIPETMPASDVVIEGTFAVNYYTVTYFIDGIVYQVDSIAYGSEIITPEHPVKDGYSFSGWRDVPKTMPAEDVEITSSFVVNGYKVTYVVDGVEYQSELVEYGSVIKLPKSPSKEGHTFSGWQNVPETMPAEDVTIEGSFAVNYYTVTYKVDGEVFATDSIAYGSELVLRDEPTKEGHTFSGWSEAPATMPAEDVTIEGTFAVNYYTVTYIVDGEVYATETIAYGSEIVLLDEPTKEGHTFSGWSEAPMTMPAEDVIIEGTFAVNYYTVTYIVDGEVYATETIAYGSEIVLRDEPTKEGHTFSGWSEAPATMPAEDITIEGTFTVNNYTVTYLVDGEVYATETVAYGSEITSIEAPIKEGHTFSGWSEAPATMPAEDITIEGSFTVIYYTITYDVDYEVYAIDSVAYGSEIILRDKPIKEGYTFRGWSAERYPNTPLVAGYRELAENRTPYGIPTVMPAYNFKVYGGFTVNYYTITYLVDGEVYATETVSYGSEIKLINEPTKEGHSFSGWSEAPATMPAEDITIEGSFAVNYYTVTYIVDGEIFATDSIAYGSELVLRDEPTKEGYTFSGWSEAPATMPAHDIVVEGTFSPITIIDEIKCDIKERIIYNLRGERIINVDKLERGFYIIDGKKVWIN